LRAIPASLGVAIWLLAVVPTTAEVVKLSFSGTYDTEGTTVFGLSGAAVPYHYEITYDTSLDTNTSFFDTGETIPVFVIENADTTHQWYGYSPSGILSSSLTFGTKTWTEGQLLSLLLGRGPAAAELWFDTNISVATPTRTAITLGTTKSGGILHLGRGVVDHDTATIFLRQDSMVTQFDSLGAVLGNGHSSLMAIERMLVPEPSGLAILLFALTFVSCRYSR
jgi:hypothetical protein